VGHRVHWLAHVPFEDPGFIRTWSKDRGGHLDATHLYRGEPLPRINDVDALIVMGGPMNVDDTRRFPWLTAETRFVAQCIEAGKPVLGICLGAQLIARAAGADVRPGEPEIGWHQVTPEPDDGPSNPLGPGNRPFDAFHWHGDHCQLPDGARRLASSAHCDNQAFQLSERVLALQFHLEITAAGVDRLLTHCEQDLTRAAPAIQTAAQIRGSDDQYTRAHALMLQLLDHWLPI
jgi:GMP synthase-like glutamine amidotransferase